MRHEGVKNHTCPCCGLRKTTMHELRTHMKNVHSKSRTIPCDFCTTMFANIGKKALIVFFYIFLFVAADVAGPPIFSVGQYCRSINFFF